MVSMSNGQFFSISTIINSVLYFVTWPLQLLWLCFVHVNSIFSKWEKFFPFHVCPNLHALTFLCTFGKRSGWKITAISILHFVEIFPWVRKGICQNLPKGQCLSVRKMAENFTNNIIIVRHSFSLITNDTWYAYDFTAVVCVCVCVARRTPSSLGPELSLEYLCLPLSPPILGRLH